MTTKKPVQANYSEALIASIVTEYQSLIIAHNGDNKLVLSLLAEKTGKTVASLRAKLASLKVYVSDKKSATPISSDVTKSKKQDIVLAISNIVGQPLDGLEAAPKNTLLAIAEKLLQQNDKINDLIADLTAENEPAICDDLN